MARSLFEDMRALRAEPAPPPRLKPNAFARLARFAWRQARVVIALWAVLALLSCLALWRSYVPPVSVNLPLPPASFGDVPNASAFGALSALQTITLSNAKPDLLADQRDELVAKLAQRDDLYQLVFAPGAGDYYEANGLLYHPLDEVKGRVAYALSLKPLFDAIAEEPSARSMATLVSEISAAIKQGRDPQGLDDLLNESAASIQALMRGEDKPVDWSKLADINEDNTVSTVTVLAVPRAGQEAAARGFVLKQLNVIQDSSDTTGTLSQPGIPPPKRTASTIDGMKLVAAAAMAAIFVALLLALALGRMGLLAAIFLPPLLFLPMVGLVLVLRSRADWLASWPLGFGLLWLACLLSLKAVFAKLTYANGGRARESTVMLADQHHGQDLIWLWLLLAAPFAALLALSQGVALALFFALLALVALAMALTLPTALLRAIPGALHWRAGEWLVPAHRALFETGEWQWLARGAGALLVAGSAAYLLMAPARTELRQLDMPVSVIASNVDEARIVIKRLQAFSEAKAVRWLGMFLPPQAAEKRAALHNLGDQFPRITPVQSEPPADIREQLDTLQDSLKEIAATDQTKPRLKMAADEFRRSIALLAATSGDQQVRLFENRLFGGFNRLAERAELLASLPEPTLATLPPALHTLFGTPEGTMRIEVTPVEGISNARLAATLEQAGFNVLHPIVEQQRQARAVSTTVNRIMALGCGLGLVLLIFSLRRARTIGMAVAMALAAGVVVLAIGRYMQLTWSFTILLEALALMSAVFGFAWPSAKQEASTSTLALELFLLPILALALVLPFVALGIQPVSNAVLPLASALFAGALVVGLLRQHRRHPEAEF